MDKNVLFVRENLSESELLALLAEEASELSQAALKLRRVITPNTAPSGKSKMEADANLLEEIADVYVCLDCLGLLHSGDVEYIADAKVKRLAKRIKNSQVILTKG